jgi:Tol biopolymer transport system component
LTSYAGSERSPSFSPDGNQVAFVWDGERADNLDVSVKLIGSGPPLRLTTDPRPDVAARWSPDGRNVAFIRMLERETFAVILVPPLGGPERKIAQFQTRVVLSGALASLCWTPDSKYLLVSGGRAPGEPNHLQRVVVDTGEVKTLLSVEGVADGYTSLALAPDGRTLAAVRLDSSGSRKLELITVTNAFEPEGTRPLPSIKSNVWDVVWTADSRDLIFSSDQHRRRPAARADVGEHEQFRHGLVA